jgi:threonine/homoserine/homoserine lactone efflux protein
MGVSMIREGGALQLEDQDDQHASIGSIGLGMRRGILLALLNPKLTLFFFAFLPQFLDAPAGLLDTRVIWLGAIFMLMTLAVFTLYAYASATVRDRVLGAPVIRRWLKRSLGTLLLGFVARLATTDR